MKSGSRGRRTSLARAERASAPIVRSISSYSAVSRYAQIDRDDLGPVLGDPPPNELRPVRALHRQEVFVEEAVEGVGTPWLDAVRSPSVDHACDLRGGSTCRSWRRRTYS